MASSNDWEWIVPFKGRNHSGAVDQNFLCRSGNVYVMDNHRAALWCWLQELNLTQPHSLIHIDRHTDALQGDIDLCLKHLPDWKSDIDTYLNAKRPCDMFPAYVIRWDNYLSIYLDQYKHSLKTLRFLTHNEGDLPQFDGTMFSEMWELPDNFSFWLSQSEAPWIVNIDLDYFYCDQAEGPQIMFSDSYLEAAFGGLREAMERNAVGVVSVCLTPDTFTAGWLSTEELAARLLSVLGFEFSLDSALCSRLQSTDFIKN